MLLTCIMTCHKNIHLWQVIRERLGAIPYLFFVGGAAETHLENNILHLACNDAYDGLVEKVLMLIHYIVNTHELRKYTHILKIDDHDTFCTEAIVHQIQYNDLDYAGQRIVHWAPYPKYHYKQIDNAASFWYQKPYNGVWTPWCGGGEAYILSRVAILAICDIIPEESIQVATREHIYEDLMIGLTLKRANIFPVQRQFGIIYGLPVKPALVR